MTKAFQTALENDHIIAATFADGSPFIIDGVQFYQATEGGVNLSIGRFHAFGDTLRRHDELKLTDELLTTGLDVLESLFKRCRAQATLDSEQVFDAAQEGMILVGRLKQRRTLGLSIEQAYEIASIFYFTEDEDPGAVDMTLSRRNISTWLTCEQSAELCCFFLSMPISSFFDYQALSDPATLSCLKEINILELLDWKRTLSRLKTDGVSSETMSIIESRMATLSKYNGLLGNLLSPTLISDQPGSGLNSVS